jgi:hypothetical protein
VNRLVWYEVHERIDEAIAREKSLRKEEPQEMAARLEDRPDRGNEPGLVGSVPYLEPVRSRSDPRPSFRAIPAVITGLVPVIPMETRRASPDRDGRDRPGHDEERVPLRHSGAAQRNPEPITTTL